MVGSHQKKSWKKEKGATEQVSVKSRQGVPPDDQTESAFLGDNETRGAPTFARLASGPRQRGGGLFLVDVGFGEQKWLLFVSS